MAIAKQGITGAFSGKIGSIIGYEVGGQNVMRTVGRRTKPFSAQELLNQAKMKAVSEFLRPIKPYVKFGFQQAAPPGSRVGAFQLAQSHTRKNAVELNAANQPVVNPERVLISTGPLVPPQRCTVLREGNRLVFQWDFLGQGASDRLVALLYDGMQFSFFREVGAERSTLTDSWEVDRLHVLKTPVHVYVAFRDTISNRISDSLYCGAV